MFTSSHLRSTLAIAGISLVLPIATAGEPEAGSAPSPVRQWFIDSLKGERMPLPDNRTLAARETADAQASLWADYKAAALAIGWDKEIAPAPVVPKMPSVEELRKLPPGERPPQPQFEASVIPCGGETMPYLLFSRGERPAKGFPMFIQTHGGGSTDEKLAGPHGWEVNTRDWKAQVGVCLFKLPEGLYFVPRMANDNKGRWWFKHNHIAFDYIIRRAILFRDIDPDRIYMMGISEGAYGTEALTPFWADRFAGGCAMAGGAGGGERFYNLRNTAFRNDTGENDTMFDRIKLARTTHEYLDKLKQADPSGYDHSLSIQTGRGHGVDYQPGPAWIATKTRNPRPAKICWFDYALDGERRTDFSWLSLAKAPERDTLITAGIDRTGNVITVSARVNPSDLAKDSPINDTTTPPPADLRIPYTGNTLTVHLDDQLLDLDKPVTVMLNGQQVFSGTVERKLANIAGDIVRHGDLGRIFPARLELKL
ncbi:MAG: hypothetical protein ABIT37_12910 [Luteolibacter sp.]